MWNFVCEVKANCSTGNDSPTRMPSLEDDVCQVLLDAVMVVILIAYGVCEILH